MGSYIDCYLDHDDVWDTIEASKETKEEREQVRRDREELDEYRREQGRIVYTW